VKAHYRHKFDLEYHGELKETRLRKCQVEDGGVVGKTEGGSTRRGAEGVLVLLVVAGVGCLF
jgi:hypothetical protein